MKLIGLIGLKQVGKDTVFSMLSRVEPTAARLAFADPLKRELAKACGVTVEYINDHKAIFRLGLQWWGTEFRRKLFGENYWIQQAEASLELVARKDRLIVFTDVRFQNEADLVKKHGGRLWRVVRNAAETNDPHASEVQQNGIKHDNCIINNGSLEQLRYCVESVYRTEFGTKFDTSRKCGEAVNVS